MYYTQKNSQLITGFSCNEVLQQLASKPQFNHRYLSQYFLNGFFATPHNLTETPFENIYRVPIGLKLEIAKDGTPYLRREWSFSTPSQFSDEITFDEALAVFQHKLNKAIQTSLPTQGVIGIELSGGVDSSSVAALTRLARPQQIIHAFSNVATNTQTKAKDDESHYSEQVAKYLALERHTISDKYHFHDILEKYTEILGSFSEVLFPITNHGCYEIAQEYNISTLLSGFGGDEVVSQHAKLYLNELYQNQEYLKYYYEKIMGKKLDDWLSKFKLKHRRASVWHKPTQHIEYLKHANLFESATIPRYTSIQAQEHAFIEGELSLHWQRRIETSQIIARHYNIDYQFPLTNPDLMCFFHHLPAKYKYKNGTGRYLMRQSMKNLLPKSIVWRDNKSGSTTPGASSELVKILPTLFLERISPSYSGTLADYINIPKLIQRMELGPIEDLSLIHLAVSVLMFNHLEHYLNAQFP